MAAGARVGYLVWAVLFGALFARLWYLQILQSTQFRVAAAQNGIRLVYTPAPRGRVLDRKGVQREFPLHFLKLGG